MRLNKGAVSLNNQELRNCLYRGKLNQMLREIVKDKDIMDTLNLKKPHPRYLDIEFLLRFLSFSENLRKNRKGYYLRDYKGSLKSYISDFMRKNQNPDKDELIDFSNKIKETFKKVNTILGHKGLLNPKTKSSQINKAFADVILSSFETQSLKRLKKKKLEIIKIKEKLLEDKIFIEAIMRRTSDNIAINTRINKWFGEFKHVFKS